MTNARRAGAARRARVVQRLAGRVHRDLHRQRHRRAQARRGVVPVQPGDRLLLTVDNHNSVNGIREFARAQGRAGRLRAADAARPAHRSRAASTRCSRRRPTGRRSVRLPGAVEFLRRQASARPHRAGARARAGTCCSMRQRSCRRTGSICRRSSRTSSAISFYKMFGYPTGVGCLLVAQRRAARRCSVRGLPAAR